uniref:Uncharacterized protein n=1 Tax=Arundo donax TaxID=35708 RepID=A0A0A9B846_ARUDO
MTRISKNVFSPLLSLNVVKFPV